MGGFQVPGFQAPGIGRAPVGSLACAGFSAPTPRFPRADSLPGDSGRNVEGAAMRIETLEEFIVVAKHLNMTKAAREIHVSQPSLSARIASMEKELGYRLFTRSNTGMALTDAGVAFLESAQDVVGSYHAGVARGRAASRSAVVRVALPEGEDAVSGLGLPRDRYPYTFVALDLNTPGMDAVARGDADISIDPDYSQVDELRDQIAEMGLDFAPFGASRCFVAVMADSPLAALGSLSRRDLDGRTIVVNSGAHFDRWSLAVRRLLGPDVRASFRMSQMASAGNIAFVDLQSSVYICASDQSRRILEGRPDVKVFDLLDGRPLLSPNAAVARAADVADPASPVRRFRDALLASAASPAPTCP